MESKDFVDIMEYVENSLQRPGFHGYSLEKKWEIINRLMQDAIDCHLWAGLDKLGNILMRSPLDRPYNPIGIAKEASKAGMKAIVLTSHVGPTFFRVPLTQKVVDAWATEKGIRPVKVIGSVTLNYVTGGLNPEIVRMCARFGGKVIYMPTIDGWHNRHNLGVKGGIELVQHGKVVPALEEILGIAADNHLVLNLTHVDPEDRMIIFDDATKLGVKGLVYLFATTNTGGPMCYATEEQWLELAKKGLKFTPTPSQLLSRERFTSTWNLMQKLGIEHLVSGTDLNNWLSRHPVDGLRAGMIRLLVSGISERDIETMFQVNPAKLLDL